jgi:hypothetical protein
MADSRSIPARATVAPAPGALKCNHWSDWQKHCCQTGHSARIRDLSAAHRRLLFGYQQVMHKSCGQPHFTRLIS